MKPELWARLKELLPRLRALDPAEREAFLASQCADEPALAEELRRLADTPVSGFLDPPTVELPGVAPTGLRPGTRLAEFEIVREIGRGGMGVVYLARQASLGRRVALKVLPAQLLPADERLSRFRVEALAAARLQHPNIVHVFSAGEQDGYRYIAMEYIEGHDLSEVVTAARENRVLDVPMPRPSDAGYARAVTEIVRAIAGALEYAHQHGILHRDVKPQNILVDAKGTAYLVDFGLAKDLGAESISVSGQILGTPYYMSPEQALARRVVVDHRTDVFSLGAVLYELLTLERPFGGDNLRRVLHAISFSEPSPIRRLNPRVHRDLETICFKALEKDPVRRFASAAAFADELGRFLANEPLSIRRSWPVERVVRRLRRNRAATSLAGLLLIFALAVPLAWRSVRASETEDLLVHSERTLADPAASPDALRSVLERLGGLDRATLSTARQGRVAQIEEHIRTRGAERKRAWRESLARALADESPATLGTTDARLEEARRLLWEARLLLPDDPELAAADDPTLPTLTLADVPDGLRVRVREIDPESGLAGPWSELGTTPLVGRGLRRGHYVVAVEQPAVGRAEMTRVLDRPGAACVLRPRILPDARATAGMLAVPGGPFTCHYHDREPAEVVLEPFWIDACETTIRDYRAYLAESGRPLPRVWTVPQFHGRGQEILAPDARTPWDDHPMSGLTLEEARAYAEWHGKRLPTALELELASRGFERRRFPWTEAEDVGEAEVRSHAVLLDPAVQADSTLELYLLRTVAVDSMPEGRSPFGLFHTYGNVKEWTETVVRVPDPAGDGMTTVPDYSSVLILGKGWDSPAGSEQGRTLFSLEAFESIPVQLAPLSLGFRCAKSRP